MHDHYIRRQRSKFECSPAQSIDVVLRGSVFDVNVLPLDIAKVAQSLPKVIPVRRVVYYAYARHSADWLLRACGQWPRSRRTAESEDEIAPSHVRLSLPQSARRTLSLDLSRGQVLGLDLNCSELRRGRLAPQCPRWIRLGHSAMSAQGPVCPRRTWLGDL